jgi:hypothetical protein
MRAETARCGGTSRLRGKVGQSALAELRVRLAVSPCRDRGVGVTGTNNSLAQLVYLIKPGVEIFSQRLLRAVGCVRKVADAQRLERASQGVNSFCQISRRSGLFGQSVL